MQTPAPLKLVTVPVGYGLKKHAKRRGKAREASRLEERVRKHVASVLPPSEDPQTGGAGAEEAPRRVTAARSWVFRHRRDVVAPVAVAVVLMPLRLVVHLASGYTAVSAALVGVPVMAVLIAGTWWARQVDPRGVANHGEGREKRRAWWAVRLSWGAVVAAALWVLAPASLPVPVWPHVLTVVPEPSTGWLDLWMDYVPPVPLTYPLLAAGDVLAVRLRWGRFAARPVEVAPVTQVEVWAEWIAGQGCKLPGSALAGVQWINGATWAATVLGVRGKQGTEEVRAARNTIAGVFGTTPERVEVQGQEDYSTPRILVTQTATLAKSRPWTPGGVDLEAGTAELGTFPDGSRSKLQLYVPGQGIRHSWMAGGTGSGKTGAVSAYLGRIMQTGIVVLDLTDLGETSLPAWVGKSFRFGTSVHDGLMTLRRANAVLDARRSAMRALEWTDRDGIARVGISTLTPSAEWPIYLAALEEWPEMLSNSEAVRLADRIGRLGRKYGVALLLVSQGTSIADAFKGPGFDAGGLRKNIRQGNVVALRGEQGDGKMAFGGGLEVNLGAIPLNNPGLGFVMSPANYRDVQSRVDWVDDDEDRPAGVPSSVEVASYARLVPPNPVDVRAVEAVEAEEAERQASAERAAAGEGTPATPVAVTRESVEAAIKRICPVGGSVRLGAVASALAPEGLDEISRKRHDDMVRKFLGELVDDPTSSVHKPLGADGRAKWGEYAA